MSTEYIKTPMVTMEGPEIEITCCSNVYIRRMTFKQAGLIELGHTHPYDHISYLSSGSIELQVYDEENKELTPPKRFDAPATIFIAKGLVHQIKALEIDTVVSCIHALRDIDGEIIDPSMFPAPTPLYDVLRKYKDKTGNNLEQPVVNDKFKDFRFDRKVDFNKIF